MQYLYSKNKNKKTQQSLNKMLNLFFCPKSSYLGYILTLKKHSFISFSTE